MPGKQHRYIGLGVIFCPLCVDSFCCTIVFYHIVKVVKRKLIVFSVVDTHPTKYGSDICGTSPSHMAKFSAAPSIPPKVSRITYLGNNYSYCLLLHSTHTLPTILYLLIYLSYKIDTSNLGLYYMATIPTTYILQQCTGYLFFLLRRL